MPWGNIFVNPASLTNTFGVIGPCGVLDEVLNQALGPDPASCADQTGPLPGEGSNASSGSDVQLFVRILHHDVDPSTPPVVGSSTSDGSDLTGPNSGLGGLSQLISPLLQGVG